MRITSNFLHILNLGCLSKAFYCFLIATESCLVLQLSEMTLFSKAHEAGTQEISSWLDVTSRRILQSCCGGNPWALLSSSVAGREHGGVIFGLFCLFSALCYYFLLCSLVFKACKELVCVVGPSSFLQKHISAGEAPINKQAALWEHRKKCLSSVVTMARWYCGIRRR